jgi:hypothetical protein
MDCEEERLQGLPITVHIVKISKDITRFRAVIQEQRNSMREIEAEIRAKGDARARQAKEVLEMLERGIERLKDNFLRSMGLEKEAISSLRAETKKISKEHLKLQQHEIVVEKEINKLEGQAGFKEIREAAQLRHALQ